MPQWREICNALAFFALAGAALAIIVALVMSINSYLRPFAAQPPLALSPDEQVLSSALANAMFATAEPHELLTATSDVLGLKHGLSAILSLFKLAYGGLWVGGRVTLTTHRLVFAPNALNRLVHHPPLRDVAFDLASVTRVTLTTGLVTDIVEVEGKQTAKLSFRCYGAAELSDLIKATAATRRASLRISQGQAS